VTKLGQTWTIPEVDDERLEVLQHIATKATTLPMLKRRTGLPERRLQRRLSDLLKRGWVEQVGRKTDVGSVTRIFGVTEDGRRNVPSGLGGSTVRG
jgi:DNA-binding HxlR family transcriptional regulator